MCTLLEHSLKQNEMEEIVGIPGAPNGLFNRFRLDYPAILSNPPNDFRRFLTHYSRHSSKAISPDIIRDLIVITIRRNDQERLRIVLDCFHKKLNLGEVGGYYTDPEDLHHPYYNGMSKHISLVPCVSNNLDCLKILLEYYPDLFASKNTERCISDCFWTSLSRRPFTLAIFLLRTFGEKCHLTHSLDKMIENIDFIVNYGDYVLFREYIRSLPDDCRARVITSADNRPLFKTIKAGDYRMAKLLLEHGASPIGHPQILKSAFAEMNETSTETDFRLVHLLLQHGARLDDVSITDEDRGRYTAWLEEEAFTRRLPVLLY